jgi:hypothetical protein
MFKASCLCKRVTYQINGPIHKARYCHCTDCRKFSGAPYAAWGLVQTSQLAISPPDAQVTKYNSGNGLRVFCTRCGSPLWYEPTGAPQFRGVPLGALDDRDVPAPERHVWVRSKVSWASISDSLPQHETHP